MKKLTMTIKVLNEIREGISQKNGNPWMRRDLICEWADGDRLNTQKFTLYGEGVTKFSELGVGVGDSISAEPFFTTDYFNGKVFNSNTLYNIEKA